MTNESSIFILVFSSSEHELLEVRYCDQSIIRLTDCPSVHALSKYFKKLNSMKNSGCHGNRVKKTLKIFLSQTLRARGLWGLVFHIEIKKEIFKNLLVPNCKD